MIALRFTIINKDHTQTNRIYFRELYILENKHAYRKCKSKIISALFG